MKVGHEAIEREHLLDVRRIARINALGNAVDVGAGLLDGNSRLPARYGSNVVVISTAIRADLIGSEGHGDPELGRRAAQYPLRGKIELLRHDADYLARLLVKNESLSKDIRIGAEAALPSPVAEHDHVVVSELVFGGGEGAAALR